MEKEESQAHTESGMDQHAMSKDSMYTKLLIMTILSFISMYILMYAMVNSFDNVYNHFNQVYMAGLMTAPMVVFALTIMSPMYKKKRLNALLIAISVVAIIIFFLFIRQQTGITDKQFLRSMIPHHSGAILMCGRASISDPEIKQLCEEIIAGQQEEINQMEAILDRLEQ